MSNPWIVDYPAPKTARLRLLCFPYAGAGASVFRTWRALLPPDVEVWAIALPGRERRWREPLVTQLDPLVTELVKALGPVLDLPFALYGHSVGALMAFELAHALQQQQLAKPLQLFVSGRQAPQCPLLHPTMAVLSDAELLRELRHYGGTPEAVLNNEALMQVLLPIIRADLTINDTYRYTPKSPLPCPMAIFGGTEDHLTNAEGLAAWQQHSAAATTLHMFAGGHFFPKTHQKALLATLNALL